MAIYRAQAGSTLPVFVGFGSSSLLQFNFNEQWLHAVSGGYDHFAMIHADVIAPPGWLNVFMRIMQEKDADVVSAVIPIKEPSGATSTAVEVPDPIASFPEHMKAIRMNRRRLEQLPNTFCATDIEGPGGAHYDGPLLVNTGLWLADLSKPWVKKWEGFSIESRILWDEDPPVVTIDPEDWRFSRFLHAQGAKVYATREVPVKHVGPWGFEHRYDK